jgi:hypothetical protein
VAGAATWSPVGVAGGSFNFDVESDQLEVRR